MPKYDSPNNAVQTANTGKPTSPKLASVGEVALLVLRATGLLEKVGFSNSTYAGQPAQNGPGMRGRSQVPPFVAPPIEVKEAMKLPGKLKEFVNAVHGEGSALRAKSIRHKQQVAIIGEALSAPVHLDKTVTRPPVDGGWVRPNQALHTAAMRHSRAGHLAGVLADVADKETAKARKALAGGVGAAGVASTAGGLALSRKKEAGVGVGAGMSTSQYSGPLSYGPFKQVSQIPGFVSPGMAKVDPSLEPGGVKAAAAATGAMSPAARLSTSQRVGAPKTTGFAGPSIADIAKPKGYGTPLAGAGKNAI